MLETQKCYNTIFQVLDIQYKCLLLLSQSRPTYENKLQIQDNNLLRKIIGQVPIYSNFPTGALKFNFENVYYLKLSCQPFF